MATASLHIDLRALASNWQALDSLSLTSTKTAAVVKADGYGLGAVAVTEALVKQGVESFFVATPEEGEIIRKSCSNAEIFVFSGYMPGDAALYRQAELIPMLNSPEQLQGWLSDMGGRGYGLQLDTGMNRLGFEAGEMSLIAEHAVAAKLLQSHLACADKPDHPMNQQQLLDFHAITDELVRESGVRRSLAATGGILLGSDFHFDMVRPGIGLYGGLPFADAEAVVRLSIPVAQCRTLKPGETVGYGGTWQATQETRVATLTAGYADGIHRALGNGNSASRGANKPIDVAAASLVLYAGDTACPLIGRVSMDLITVDVTALEQEPESMDLICSHQGFDEVAAIAGTVGYEILTACGSRYQRNYD